MAEPLDLNVAHHATTTTTQQQQVQQQRNTRRMCLSEKEKEKKRTEGCVISFSNLCAYLMPTSPSAPNAHLPPTLLLSACLPPLPVASAVTSATATATTACHALRRSSIGLIAPIAML